MLDVFVIVIEYLLHLAFGIYIFVFVFHVFLIFLQQESIFDLIYHSEYIFSPCKRILTPALCVFWSGTGLIKSITVNLKHLCFIKSIKANLKHLCLSRAQMLIKSTKMPILPELSSLMSSFGTSHHNIPGYRDQEMKC